MRVLQGGWKTAYLIFFGSHVVITALVDAQAVLSTIYPQRLRDLVAWYCALFGDVLMQYPSPPWFQSLVAGEIVLQVPFFLVALHQMTQPYQGSAHYPRWFQTSCIIYGSHVATTLVPILAAFWTSPKMTTTQIVATTSVYLPYLLFPLGILYLAAKDDFEGMMLSAKKTGSKAEVQKVA